MNALSIANFEKAHIEIVKLIPTNISKSVIKPDFDLPKKLNTQAAV